MVSLLRLLKASLGAAFFVVALGAGPVLAKLGEWQARCDDEGPVVITDPMPGRPVGPVRKSEGEAWQDCADHRKAKPDHSCAAHEVIP